MSNGPTRWPNGRSAAVSITLDNMGEAAEILRGTWPDHFAVGSHRSVTKSLPRMIDLLAAQDVAVTYFIEGWNTGVYPDVIHQVHSAGHEIGFHGWQHEPWATLEPAREAVLIDRSVREFQSLGVPVKGFRPPGGILTSKSAEFLSEAGITFCSPAGSMPALDTGLVYLPFEWRSIDAYYYSDGFGGLREIKGDTHRPLGPRAFEERVRSIVELRVRSGGYLAILFHPFLEHGDDRFETMRRIIEMVQQDERVWCAPCGQIADWIRANPDQFGTDPALDRTTWTR